MVIILMVVNFVVVVVVVVLWWWWFSGWWCSVTKSLDDSIFPQKTSLRPALLDQLTSPGLARQLMVPASLLLSEPVLGYVKGLKA